MSVIVRTRRQSHPPPGEEELPQTQTTAASKVLIRRIKSGFMDTKQKPVKLLKRVNTVHYDKKIKPAVTNNASFNVVSDLLMCKLCEKRLKRPKMLPCQHTFCMACLQQRVQPSDKVIKCPDCGQEANLRTAGPDGIAELPPNLYLDSLLTALQQEPVNFNLNQQADARCAKCQTMGATQCQHCRQAFCAVCWPGHIAELKSQLPSLLDQLKAAEQSLAHHKEGFQEVCGKVKERINAAVEVKIQKILAEQEELNKKANEIQENGNDSYKQLIERLKSAEIKISSTEEFDSLSEHNKKVGQFLKLHGMTSNLLNEVSRWGESRPMFNQETFQIEMGDIKKSHNANDEEDVFYEEDIQNVDSPDALSLYYRSRSFVPRINMGRSILRRPAGVGVAPWDDGIHMYVAGTDGKQVLVIDSNRMKLVHQLISPNMLYPHGIAFCKSLRQVYVTDKWNHCIHGNDRVQVLDPEDGSVIRVLGILDPLPGHKYKRTEFNQPTGIAVCQDKVVIIDMGNKRVKIYSPTGEKLNEFGSMGVGHGQFRTPECVALDRMGFILVGDSTTARVQIFRPDGILIRVFGGNGSSPGKFAGVNGIAVSDNMDIIVTDTKNGSVQIF
ncbi:hypothetical protein L9F63_018998 [Diploptera punctata]|uniref:RING-type domain-containing protein n=1 Tax=Diploptera punctata TaxID=6984 RepID=A0AAD7ZWR2_DIPPU|nr:hypothetical protein L9F63_018998 [Diploptera punctata]